MSRLDQPLIQLTQFFVHFLSRSYALHVIAITCVVVYLWPYWILGQDAHVLVHDQLDSVFVSIKVLAESNLLFAHPDTPIPDVGNNVTRLSYPSAFYGVVWLFKFFGAFGGYVVTQFIVRLIAYWGMYHLLSDHYLTKRKYRIPNAIAAISFACLPHYSLFGLSITGQPLFFRSILNIRVGRSNLIDWIVCGLFPMCSQLALGGLFTIAVAGLIWLVDFIVGHPGLKRLFFALSLTTLSALVVEYQMVMVVLGLAKGFVSHRTEFRSNLPNVSTILETVWYNFKYGQYHAPSLQGAVIFPSALVALVLVAWGKNGLLYQLTAPKRLWFHSITIATLVIVMIVLFYVSPKTPSLVFCFLVTILMLLMPVVAIMLTMLTRDFVLNNKKCLYSQPVILLVWSLTTAIGLSLFYALSPIVWKCLSILSPRMPYFNLSRFHYLHPMLWSMVLAAVLAVMLQQKKVIGVLVLALIITLHGTMLVKSAEYQQAKISGDPTFREFFSPQLFNEIIKILESEESFSSVVSVGLHPAIATYNRLHTLDGYLPNYPLAYKKSFRDIIASELDKSDNYKSYFDDWGSRFYIFAHDLEPQGNFAFALTKERVQEMNVQLEELLLDTEVLAAMRGSHILSATQIKNAEDIKLDLVSEIEHLESPWHLFIYKIRTQPSELHIEQYN